MNRFRNRSLQLLIATDVAARGLDVNDLTHVINYNLPDDPEVYIHRSGRTGRAGKSGVSMTIIHSREMRKIKELEKLTKRIEGVIKQAIGLAVKVKLVEPKTLDRSEGKSVHVIDHRVFD